jgi:hypothetical protein
MALCLGVQAGVSVLWWKIKFSDDFLLRNQIVFGRLVNNKNTLGPMPLFLFLNT